MSKSYLDAEEKYNKYLKKDSYYSSDFDRKQYMEYAPLPEEYDIFSEIKIEAFKDICQEQMLLLTDFLNELREKLKYLVSVWGIVRVLPKLNVMKDSEDALIVNWAYSNYRIFINIEKKVEESFYGIVAQDEEKNFFSNSGKFDECNYKLVINKILDYIFNQS